MEVGGIESEQENIALAGVLGGLYGTGMARKYWIGLAEFGEGLNWTWHIQAQELIETIQNRPWIGWFNQLTSYTESYRRKVPLLSENATHETWAPNQPDTNGDDDDYSDGGEEEYPQVVPPQEAEEVGISDYYSDDGDESDDGDDGHDGDDGDNGKDIDDVVNENENCAYISIGIPHEDSFGKWNVPSCDMSLEGMAWQGKVGIGAICKAMP